MWRQLQALGQGIRQAANLMVGLPDYEAYVRHVRQRHPDQEPMSRETFFRNRLEARYGKGGGRCC